jgi:hypothetical protein
MKNTFEIEIYYLTEYFDKEEMGLLFFEEGEPLPTYRLYDLTHFWAFILNIPDLQYPHLPNTDFSFSDAMKSDYRYWQINREWDELLKDLVEFVRTTDSKTIQ